MHIGVILSMKSGLEHFVYREVSEFARRGATISLFPCKHRPGLYNPLPEWHLYSWRIWQVLLSQPLRFASMPLRYLTLLWFALRHRAVVDFLLAAYFVSKMQDVDVVYATFGDRKLFTGYFCKRFTGKPLTVTIHAYELYANPNPPLFPIALEACDQIVTVTEYNRDVLRDRFQVDPKRVEVVRLSVDLEEYKPADKFIVLIVAFFVEKKGHEVLFKAIRELGYDDIEVWVVGGDGGSDSHVDVHELARQHGVENQVAFFGKLSGTALRAVYHACDVFCLPSRFDSDGQGEGFPTVIIEAMACGKPVVTTNHVEIPRIVEQLVVPENDAAALAEALQTTYASRHLRETMGKRNRELAEIHFSNANTEEKLNLFRELCKGMAAQQDHLAEATENHNQHCLAIEEVV